MNGHRSRALNRKLKKVSIVASGYLQTKPNNRFLSQVLEYGMNCMLDLGSETLGLQRRAIVNRCRFGSGHHDLRTHATCIFGLRWRNRIHHCLTQDSTWRWFHGHAPQGQEHYTAFRGLLYLWKMF